MVGPAQRLLQQPTWTTRAGLRFALFQGAFICGVTAQKAGANALFLSRATPERLPYLYLGVALLVALSTTLLARLLSTKSAARLLPPVVFFESLAMVALALGVGADVPYASGTLYLVTEAGTSVVSILIWARVTDAFGARDQRRVVGLISAAGMVGSMVGGALVTFGASAIGVPSTVVVSALFAPAALLVLRRIRGKTRQTAAAPTAPMREGARYLFSAGLPRAVAVLVVLFAATAAIVDYVFRLSTAAAYNEVELTSIFGLLNAGVGVAAALFQLLLTPRLLSRFGVFWFAAIVPFFTLALALTTFAVPTFWPLTCLFGLKFIEMMGAYSLNSTAITLLYNPMPEEVRAQVRALIDGTIKKAGAAAAGLMLIVLVTQWPPRSLLLASVFTSAIVLALLPLIRRQYIRALDAKLGRRRRRTGIGEVLITDKETIACLVRALASDDVLRTMVALRALASEAALPREMVDQLLQHPEEEVRTETLLHVPLQPDATLAGRLVDLARNQRAPVRSREAAVSALARCAGDDLKRLVEPFLDDSEQALALAAVFVLLSKDENARARKVLDAAVRTLHQCAPEVRERIARGLGDLDERRYDATLVELLHDDRASVKRQALAAAGREQRPEHLAALIECLADASVRGASVSALVAYGDAAVEAVAKELSASKKGAASLRHRRHLPRVLAQIGTEKAAAALLMARPKDEAALQRTCIERLLEIVRKAPQTPIDEEQRIEAIAHRLRLAQSYRESRRRLSTLEVESPNALAALRVLQRVVLEREDQALRLAHLLMGLASEMDRAMAAYRVLSPLSSTASDQRRRQDALELLDQTLNRHRRRDEIMRLLEDHEVTTSDRTSADEVDALQRSADPLLRGLARRAATMLGLPEREVSLAHVDAKREHEDIHGDNMDESTLNRAVAIAHTDLFEGLSLDDLAMIATVAKERTLAPGEVLYRQGDVGESLHIVQEGRVHLHKDGAHVMTLEEGESAGQVSFLDRGARPVTARVSRTSPATVLTIERGDLMDLFADRPALMKAFFAVVGARLRALLERDASPATLSGGQKNEM